MEKPTPPVYAPAADIESLKENIAPAIDKQQTIDLQITSEQSKEKLMHAVGLCREKEKWVTERRRALKLEVQSMAQTEQTRPEMTYSRPDPEKADHGTEQTCALKEQLRNAQGRKTQKAGTRDKKEPSLPLCEKTEPERKRKFPLKELESRPETKALAGNERRSRRVAYLEGRKAALAPRHAKKEMSFDNWPTLQQSEEMSKQSRTKLKNTKLKSVRPTSAARAREQSPEGTSEDGASNAFAVLSVDDTDPENGTSAADQPAWLVFNSTTDKPRSATYENSDAVAHKFDSKAPAAFLQTPASSLREPSGAKGMCSIPTQNGQVPIIGRNEKQAQTPKQAPKSVHPVGNIGKETAQSEFPNLLRPTEISAKSSGRPHPHPADEPNVSEDEWKMRYWSRINIRPVTDTGKGNKSWKDTGCLTSATFELGKWSGIDATEAGQVGDRWNYEAYCPPDSWKVEQRSYLNDTRSSDAWDVDSWSGLQKDLDRYCSYYPDLSEINDEP
ncbi:hypothetical protein V5799_004162 [Amblyomma americanum]|uniref:Uncharacterized protein n=1 Tax=Amblyomma americanum TaxID=6943 RepID=A0AAQ4D6W2_AMBAM